MNKTECKAFIKSEITGRWPEYPITGALAEDLIITLEQFTYEQAKQAARELRKQNGFNKLDIGELERYCKQARQQHNKPQQVFVYVIFPEKKRKLEFWVSCKYPVDFTDQQQAGSFTQQVHAMIYNYQEFYNLVDDPEIYIGEENRKIAQNRFYEDILCINAQTKWQETLKMLSDKFKAPTCNVPF